MSASPILLSSCAKATTAAEARFRLDVPIAPARAARVVALDAGAATIVREVAELPWASARFFVCENPGAGVGSAGIGLKRLDGTDADLGEELAGVDVTVMIATTDGGADAVSTIGAACTVRGIMTAGLVLGDDIGSSTVSALRPYARVLLVSTEENDLVDVLTALRA
jgi:hypothetical protein